MSDQRTDMVIALVAMTVVDVVLVALLFLSLQSRRAESAEGARESLYGQVQKRVRSAAYASGSLNSERESADVLARLAERSAASWKVGAGNGEQIAASCNETVSWPVDASAHHVSDVAPSTEIDRGQSFEEMRQSPRKFRSSLPLNAGC